MSNLNVDLRKFFRILKSSRVEKFYFDDENFESIVYGKKKKKNSLANLYLKSDQKFEELEKSFSKNNKKEIISKISQFVKKNRNLSDFTIFCIMQHLIPLIPLYPCPNLKYNLRPLKETMNKAWDSYSKRASKERLLLLGDHFYRFYEHIKEYKRVIKIINKLLKIETNNFNQGILLNNLAFEYFLQNNFNKAKQIFKKAMKIFIKCKNEKQFYNSFCNYMFCELKLNNFENLIRNKKEIAKSFKYLKNNCEHQARKPLILLAKIEEYRGNYKSAILLVKKALKIQRNKKTIFYFKDKIYFDNIKLLLKK